ncbi:glycoside hydrolase family 65 protein [Thermoanaerobacterium thermosaccharolyticum]|uniref:glycoside hydrolase family 65 protein n=1 Tax=Thermoanaerobacterium thermosaccharolyticum TaxID=1517 RepID=UPI003DAA0C4F
MKKSIYPYEEWKIRENAFDINMNYRNETIFSLGNGYFGMRGTFEEGYTGPDDTTFNATYINGFYEVYDIKYTEGGYGFPSYGEAMVNVADSKIIKLFIDNEPFDILKGNLISYERVLDMKEGFTERKLLWETETGKRIEIIVRRLISFKRQHLGVIVFLFKPINFSGNVKLISEIDGNINYRNESEDVRVGSNMQGKVMETLDSQVDSYLGWIMQSTKRSKLKYVCSFNHEIKTKNQFKFVNYRYEDKVGIEFNIDARKGETFELTKYISYYTSRECAEDCIIDEALKEVENAKRIGVDIIFKEQSDYLNEFWADADVVIDGDISLQQGIRYNEFQLLQSVSKNDITNICAKGLTGEGYEGHYFWDSDIYIMPFFLYTKPEIAKNFVMFRYNLLDAARKRAKELGYKGALYPWRTIDGPECSSYFPAGTAQYHINSDIVLSIKKYVEATLDYDFLFKYGAEVVFETARLWISIGSYIPLKNNKFCINCVTGPDEYTALVDNNAYTNYMAQMNLEYAYFVAKEMIKKAPDDYKRISEKISLSDDELEEWNIAAQNMYLPYSDELNIIPQDDSFLYKEKLNVKDLESEKPLLLHRHYLNIYRYQICKQPDVLLLMYLRRELFSIDEIKRNYDYYEPITTHDSSLSPAIFSILANEVGYYEKAYDYFMMTARMDLDDYNGNVKDGIHTACMAGAWSAIINGFGGMMTYHDGLHFMPNIPVGWRLLSYNVKYKNCKLHVDITQDKISFLLIDGAEMRIYLYDEEILLSNSLKVEKEVKKLEEQRY